MSNKGWIGVDLDGTLAHYDGWKGVDHIGEPVPAMVDRVKAWLAEGKDVRIFTARVFPYGRGEWDSGKVLKRIEDWCEKHLGTRLPVTYQKDFNMMEIWDDRAVQIIPNTGERADCTDIKNLKLKGLVREFLGVLETTETTDQGREFHPTTISSCRVMTTERLGRLLAEMKALAQ